MVHHDHLLFHLLSRYQWEQAQALGNYTPLSLQTEGFIHASTAQQVFKVANRFYQGQKDLILLCLDPQKIQAEIKWEAPIHPQRVTDGETWQNERFPHIYGALNLDAVTEVIPFSVEKLSSLSLPTFFQSS